MMDTIASRLEPIRLEIPKNVRLIAVSKGFSQEAIREAYGSGIRDFGENRLTEALTKQEELKDLPEICWHFIGHVQTNKARKIVQHFDWIHSVDSLNLAWVLNRLAAELSLSPQIFLQVKMLPDPNKYGWEPRKLQEELAELSKCQKLKIKGLMTILPQGLSESQTLDAFEATRELQEKIKGENWPNISLEELSMGMSGDYLLAVKAGATMIRLGQIIFGERKR